MRKLLIRQLEKSALGRRIAVGDIHGNFKHLRLLIETEIGLTKKDQLFLLGDLINRGNQSRLVLDYLLDLKANGYQVYPIMGNHEIKLLMAYGCGFDFFADFLDSYNSIDLLDGDLHLYLNFISSFDYCIELDNFTLSHPGLDLEGKSPSTDLRGMFSNVDFGEVDWQALTNKRQVHGHQTVTVEQVEKSIWSNHRRISLDAGCENSGILVALNLDSLVLYKIKS